ncbi:hypothetical protein ACSBR1_013398 [Camellia fascicularis]
MSCGKESGETDEIYECNFEDILDVSKKIEASKVEMTFGSKDEAHQYYASYARQEGFEVMIRSSRQGDNGSIKYFTLACARTGKTGYDDGRLKNVFWADARGRATYESFGDVVSFDSTYLTNKYDMPFTPFVGASLGMSTTQCSESMNAFFDGYVNSKTTLKQFVEQYDNALRSKVEKGNQETNEQVQQYDKLCSYFYEIAEIATESEEKCNHLMSCLSEIKEKMQKTDDRLIESQCPSLSPCNKEFNGMSKPCIKVLSPLPVRAKGRPPSKRKESKIDQLVRKKKVEFFKSYIQVAMEGERF